MSAYEVGKPSNKVALITGASSGIGASFARALAIKGYDLILVARRKDRLNQLACELASAYHIHAEILVADLSHQDSIESVNRRISNTDNLTFLINNAGFGLDEVSEYELQQTIDMLQVHLLATINFVKFAVPKMIANNQGYIINVASIAGFIPVSSNTIYGATKTLLIVFSEQLKKSLSKTNIKVQALCPGFTYTEFHDQLKHFNRNNIPRFLWKTPEEIVDISINALDSDQVVVIPGLFYRLLTVFSWNYLSALYKRIYKLVGW